MAYSRIIRNRARKLWLEGRTYEEICKLKGMPKRPATIHEWNVREGWAEEKEEIAEEAKKKRIDRTSTDWAAEQNQQIVQVQIVSRKVNQFLARPDLSPQELRLCVDTLDKGVRLLHYLAPESKQTEYQSNEAKDIAERTKEQIMKSLNQEILELQNAE